jgi:hypothetical protein
MLDHPRAVWTLPAGLPILHAGSKSKAHFPADCLSEQRFATGRLGGALAEIECRFGE